MNRAKSLRLQRYLVISETEDITDIGSIIHYILTQHGGL